MPFFHIFTVFFKGKFVFLYNFELTFPFGKENYATWQHLLYTTQRKREKTYDLLVCPLKNILDWRGLMSLLAWAEAATFRILHKQHSSMCWDSVKCLVCADRYLLFISPAFERAAFGTAVCFWSCCVVVSTLHQWKTHNKGIWKSCPASLASLSLRAFYSKHQVYFFFKGAL